MKKAYVVKILIDILQRYDIVLIQEIRDVSETAIVDLLDQLNEAVTDPYDMVLSARLGRSSSKEQYAYFYKPSLFRVVQTYQYPESLDQFERPPFSVIFYARNSDVQLFGFMGIHVKPSDAPGEIDRLVDVYDTIVPDISRVKDFIIAGDFNAGCDYVPPSNWEWIRLRTEKRFHWMIRDGVDTTVNRKTCAYDRIILVGEKIFNSFVSGSARAYYFDKDMNIDLETAMDVSDHYPVELRLQ